MDHMDLDVRCPRKVNVISHSLTIYPIQSLPKQPTPGTDASAAMLLTEYDPNLQVSQKLIKNSYIYWINSRMLTWCYIISSLIPHV